MISIVKTGWKRIIGYLHHFDRIFFAGPAVFNYPGKSIKGYRSVNLLIIYWLCAVTVLKFTLAGRVLLVATGYFALASMLTLLMPMYLLSIAMIALFLVNMVVGWYYRRVPRIVSALQPFTLHYTIRNIHTRDGWDLIIDTIPFPAAIRLVDERAYIDRLKPEQSQQLTHTVIAGRRGVFQLPLPIVSSAFPFGLWRWNSRGSAIKFTATAG
jgi:uncharacterized protein (DUF58 family)